MRSRCISGLGMALMGLALLLGAGGCGPTVGDSCTTHDDCGEGICLNEGWTPGGYCSKSCVSRADDDCPNGSVCTEDALGLGQNVCLLSCENERDCRSGYLCAAAEGAQLRVCQGPDGL